MAKFGKTRNFKKQKESTTPGVFDEGNYPAEIIESEINKNSAKTGKVLKLVFKIIKGEFKGRKVFGNYNIENPNEIAEDIAWSELKSLSLACGMDDFPKDTKRYHKIPFMLSVGVEPENTVGKGKRKKTYKAKNKPVGYAPLETGKKGKGKKGKKGKKPF